MAHFRDNARIVPFFAGNDLLAAAIQLKKADDIDALINNAALDQKGLDRYMALANQCFEPTIFAAMLKAGANPDINNGALLYSAMGEDTPQKLEILLAHKADINRNNGHLAVRAIEMDCENDSYTGKRSQFLDSLLKFGIKLEGTNNAALKTAIDFKDATSFKKLIAHGAAANIQDNTALDLAEKGGFKEGADILRSYRQIEKTRAKRLKQEEMAKRKSPRDEFHNKAREFKAQKQSKNTL